MSVRSKHINDNKKNLYACAVHGSRTCIWAIYTLLIQTKALSKSIYLISVALKHI